MPLPLDSGVTSFFFFWLPLFHALDLMFERFSQSLKINAVFTVCVSEIILWNLYIRMKHLRKDINKRTHYSIFGYTFAKCKNWNKHLMLIVYHRLNAFIPKFLKWTHRFLNLDLSTNANMANCRCWWDGSLWAIMKTRLFKYIENFMSKNCKFSDKKFWYFSYFCSKHRLLVLVRTASPRRF